MRYDYDQLLTFAVGAGFSDQTAPTIAAIALAESGGDDQAVNPADPNGGSFGVLQINNIHAGAKDTLGNPALAFKMAYAISKNGSDFAPWSTFTSGRYRKYLPAPPKPETPSTKGPTMNPAANAATSGGTAGAAVIVLGWVLSWWHIPLPPDASSAIGILLTAAVGYLIHTQTRS